MYIWKCAYDLQMKKVHIKLSAVGNITIPGSPFVSLSLSFRNTVSKARSRNKI